MSLNREENVNILNALSNGNVNDVKSVLDAELETATINAPLNSRRDTVLVYAARNGNPNILKFLIEKGADVNAANAYSETPLIAAIKSNKAENAIFMIRQRADINRTDWNGCSALIAACKRGLEDVVQELISKGVNVNYRDPSRWTALMWCIFSLKRRSYTIAKILLDANADTCFRYDRIGTVYDFAKSLYCDEVAELICEYEDMPEETISDWEYLKDQILNEWNLTRDIANILNRCNSLKALYFVTRQKKMNLADFLSQTPEEINELPTLTYRKRRLNRVLRKFHLHQWSIECLGLDFVKNVSKQEANASAQITFVASVARHLMVISGSIGYIQKNMCTLTENEVENILQSLTETKTAVMLVKGALTKVLQTVKEDRVLPADWIPVNCQNRRRKRGTVITGVIFTMSVLFVCWEESSRITYTVRIDYSTNSLMFQIAPMSVPLQPLNAKKP